MRRAVAIGVATLALCVPGALALAGWTAGAVLTLDGVPIIVLHLRSRVQADAIKFS